MQPDNETEPSQLPGSQNVVASLSSRRAVLIASALIFVLCVSSRLAILAALGVPPEPERTEVNNVAISLAQGRGFANAFGPDSGPTAHTAPIYPFMLSVLYRVWGTERAGALAQVVFGYGLAGLGYAMMPFVAQALGIPAAVGIVAGLAAALLPISFYAERGTCEDPLTALVMILLVLLQAHIQRRRAHGVSDAAGLGLVYGCALLVSPVLLIVIVVFSLFNLVRGLQTTRNLVVAAACTVAVLVPWTLRNRSAVGHLVWLRSNFGLELSMSNMDGAKPALEDNSAPGGVHRTRHPYLSIPELSIYRRLGEIRYNQARLAEGLTWVREHRAEFAKLALQRMLQFWFPVSNKYFAVTIAVWLITMFAIAGIVLLGLRDFPTSLPIVIPFLVFPLVYYIIETSRRYRYPLEALMMLMACYTVFRLAAAITGRASLSADARRDSEASSTRVRSATSA